MVVKLTRFLFNIPAIFDVKKVVLYQKSAY